MSTAKVKTVSKVKSKLGPEVEEIIRVLNDKNIRLSMIEYSNLVHKLFSKHRIKPSVLEKMTEFSLPHIYNLICLGGMTPKMKQMVVKGKIKGTDALKLLRKSKNEEEFLAFAYQLAESKTDSRKKEFKEETKTTKAKAEPKRNSRNEKVKQLILEIIGGQKVSKNKHHTISSLVDQLMAVA